MKKTFVLLALTGILIFADTNSASAQRSFFGGRGNGGSGLSIGFGLGNRGYGNNYYGNRGYGNNYYGNSYYGNRGYSPYGQNYGYPYGGSQFGYSQYSPLGFGYSQSTPVYYGNSSPSYTTNGSYYSTPTTYSTSGYTSQSGNFGPSPCESASSFPITQASYSPQNYSQNLSSAVTVKVPTAETQVWLGTTEMSTLGKEHVFQMSDLEPGRVLTLTVTARWTTNGKAVEQSRQVELVGGKNNSVTFN